MIWDGVLLQVWWGFVLYVRACGGLGDYRHIEWLESYGLL